MSGPLDWATVEELRRVAHSRPASGRQAAAKASAIRTLERLSRGGRLAQLPMPDGWHPNPGTEWESLDAGDSVEVRERWWRALLAERRL